MSIQFFFTAWDPSDLPGASVDPLGFDRAYSALADLWLPGLTNVASQPRYFAVLCAGALLGDVSAAETPREERTARVDGVLRLERLWALAHALDDEGAGIRGIRYASLQAQRLTQKGAVETTIDFPLLSHQARYGVVGIYSNVASGLRLIDPDTLRPSADLGARLGALFRKSTKIPAAIVEAAAGHTNKVPLKALSTWIEQSRITVTPSKDEAECYREALDLHPLRARVAALLLEQPAREDESELDHLRRVQQRLISARRDADLVDVIEGIGAVEDIYRLLLLMFERVLWRAAHATRGGVDADDLRSDEVLVTAATRLRPAWERLERAIDGATTAHLAPARARLEDVRTLAAAAKDAATDVVAVVDVVGRRHADVQGGKVFRGQRKSPYIEKHDQVWTLCLGRAGDSAREVKSIDAIRPHEYRVRSAVRLAGGAV